MNNYATYLDKVLKRKVWRYRNLTFNFDKVTQDSDGIFDFYISVKPDTEDSFLHTQVLDKIELIIKNAFKFLSDKDGGAYVITATYNDDFELTYGDVFLSEEDLNEIMNTYNYYMKLLRRFGVSQRLVKFKIDNSTEDAVGVLFGANLGLPKDKTIKDLPLEAIQNAMYEYIETLLDEKFTDDEGQGVTFNVKIRTNN
jgi:hypothetical protein